MPPHDTQFLFIFLCVYNRSDDDLYIYDVETSSQTMKDRKQCVECDWNIDTYYECYTNGDGPYKDSHVQ